MRELHIVVRAEDPRPFTLEAVLHEALGSGAEVEWHEHTHEHEAPGGEIVGWEVIVITSHPSHNAALLHADVERERNSAADIELQPVIDNRQEEEEAA
jgi:hypothetical protein